jgi:hypothetical protein
MGYQDLALLTGNGLRFLSHPGKTLTLRRLLKNSSTGAHRVQIGTGDLSRAGRFGKVA